MTVWERFNTWWAVRRAKKALATSVPPLDMTEPEDVTLNDLVNSLEQTGKAALGAAVCVTEATTHDGFGQLVTTPSRRYVQPCGGDGDPVGCSRHGPTRTIQHKYGCMS